MRAAFLGLLLICGGAAPPATQGSYVPAGIWRDPEQEAHFERWFGDQLRAMREPVLSRMRDRAGFRRRFRMLVLPSFHPAYAIRIDEEAAGGARVRIVRLGGAGGYTPGGIKQEESFTLGADAVRQIDAAIEASGLAALAPDSDRSLCLDGARFVFELIDERSNRFVTRHQCELGGALESLVSRIDALRRTVGSDLGEYRSNGTLR